MIELLTENGADTPLRDGDTRTADDLVKLFVGNLKYVQ